MPSRRTLSTTAFDPIISYGIHAAINHYSATSETDIAIEPGNFLLADTGGHYYEGTTDTTRTIVMGSVNDEQKKYFTAVFTWHAEPWKCQIPLWLYWCKSGFIWRVVRYGKWDRILIMEQDMELVIF